MWDPFGHLLVDERHLPRRLLVGEHRVLHAAAHEARRALVEQRRLDDVRADLFLADLCWQIYFWRIYFWRIYVWQLFGVRRRRAPRAGRDRRAASERSRRDAPLGTHQVGDGSSAFRRRRALGCCPKKNALCSSGRRGSSGSGRCRPCPAVHPRRCSAHAAGCSRSPR